VTLGSVQPIITAVDGRAGRLDRMTISPYEMYRRFRAPALLTDTVGPNGPGRRRRQGNIPKQLRVLSRAHRWRRARTGPHLAPIPARFNGRRYQECHPQWRTRYDDAGVRV